jgi:hypothetical protein
MTDREFSTVNDRVKRRQKLDDVFGEVLPIGEAKEPSVSSTSVDNSLNWHMANRPPHHDGKAFDDSHPRQSAPHRGRIT